MPIGSSIVLTSGIPSTADRRGELSGRVDDVAPTHVAPRWTRLDGD